MQNVLSLVCIISYNFEDILLTWSQLTAKLRWNKILNSYHMWSTDFNEWLCIECIVWVCLL